MQTCICPSLRVTVLPFVFVGGVRVPPKVTFIWNSDLSGCGYTAEKGRVFLLFSGFQFCLCPILQINVSLTELYPVGSSVETRSFTPKIHD
jgi:hypothetical protein